MQMNDNIQSYLSDPSTNQLSYYGDNTDNSHATLADDDDPFNLKYWSLKIPLPILN